MKIILEFATIMAGSEIKIGKTSVKRNENFLVKVKLFIY